MEWGPDHLERARATDAAGAPRLTGYLLLDLGPLIWAVWISRLLGPEKPGSGAADERGQDWMLWGRKVGL